MKTALVTGGAIRIGAAIVRALSADGWRVIVHYNSSSADAEALAAELNDTSGQVETICCDFSDLAATQRLVADCVNLAGPLDCLINNASLFEPDWLGSLDPAQWQRQLDVNLRAPALLTKAFADVLPEGRDGCIINMLDNKIFSPNPDYFSYSIGKFGLKGLTEMAAMALGPRIRVCGIAPGLTMISGDQTEQDFDRQSRINLLERSSAPKEIAKAVQFILSSDIYNGQILVMDGGQSLMGLPRDVAFLDG
ncbi:MAG: Pyridoxal 4-dehydrogenase [Alphaproteobacteria bacterium MarineAlpha4_Bin2]|nr:MAG: Pyridoxal 4-dehydrogenase [Alphaproteobacteria bacterium MarineAlpha4_Bin2]